MGEKLKDLKPNTTVPGAGQYDPKASVLQKTMPAFSMKAKLGSSLQSPSKFVPGPGNYESHLKMKRDAPRYGFGSSTRDGLKTKLNVPGPGSYRLRSTIGDVPEYAGTNRSDGDKYV